MREEPGLQQPVASDPASAEQSEIHLTEYWSIIVAGRHIILASLILSLLVAVYYCIFTPPSYRARTVLFVDRDKEMEITTDAGSRFVSYDPEFIPTQIQLIRGLEISQRVVQQLDLVNDPEFNPPKKSWFGSAAPAQRRVRESAEGDIVRTAQSMQGRIEVIPIRGSTVLQVFYTGPTPKISARVANAVANAYIDWMLESKYQALGQVNQFIGTQIEQLKSEIDLKSQQLQAYSDQKDIVSTGGGNVTMQNLESLNKDYAEAMSDRVSKEARWHEMENGNAESIADTSSNGLISTLRGEQAKLEREYSEKLSIYKPEWPAMQQLKAQVEKGRQHVDQEISRAAGKARQVARSEYLTALRKEESLKAVLAGQKREAMTLNRNSIEYNNLKTEVETKRSLLDSLLKRQAENQVMARSRGERMSNIRVVERAFPPLKRFAPSYKHNLFVGLLAGLAIGIGLVFLRDYLDRSIKTPEQVGRYLQLPVLGVIPSVGAETSLAVSYGYGGHRRDKRKGNTPKQNQVELLPEKSPRSNCAEAYRAFRTALLLSQPGGVKSLVITSTVPGEGKTVTASNLAVVLAQFGRRVLLIDADLHKPRLHEVFQISNRVGLVSILAGTATPSTAIVSTNVRGVYVLPAGPIAPNPSRLLASESMRQLLQLGTAQFDHVIIDSPPTSPISDSLLLGVLCDGIVLCVQARRTPRNMIVRIRDEIARANVNIIGALLNNYQEHAMEYRSYYYAEYAQPEKTPHAAAASGNSVPFIPKN